MPLKLSSKLLYITIICLLILANTTRSQESEQSIDTRLGTLEIMHGTESFFPCADFDYCNYLSLNKEPIQIYNGESLWFEKHVVLPTEDVIILSSDPDGTWCDIMYRFIILKDDGNVIISETCGTYKNAISKIIQDGNKIQLTFPVRLKPDEILVTYDGKKIVQKGKAIKPERIIKTIDKKIQYAFPNIKEYIGQHPDKALTDINIQKALRKLLKNDFDLFVENIELAEDTKLIGTYFWAHGCKPHICNVEASAFCIDIISGKISAAILHDKIMNLYEPKEFDPEPFNDWVFSSEYIKSKNK